MASLIEQIQRDALDPNVPVAALLRRVKLAAAKLGLKDIEGWVNSELKGYDVEAPEYRLVRGVPKAWNHHFGRWQAIVGSVEGIPTTKIGQSIAAIEDLVVRSGGKSLLVNYPSELIEELGGGDARRWALHVDGSQLVAIIDHVRSLVLEWAIELERAGITGTEFSFLEEEKAKAHEASTIINVGTIGSLIGNIGSGNTSGAITVSGLDLTQVRNFTDQLERHADELEAGGIPREAFKGSLKARQAEIARETPDDAIVGGLVSDIRNAMSGAAGNLI